MRSLQLRTAILDLTQGEPAHAAPLGSGPRRPKRPPAFWVSLGGKPSTFPTAGWRTPGQPHQDRSQATPVAARVVILPYWQGRHPDHYNTSGLGYEACFLSGLAKIDTGDPPFRPFKILYARPLRGRAAQFCSRHHALHRAAVSRFARLSLAVCRSAIRRSPLCPPRRNSRTHLLSGPSLRTTGRRSLCRALRAEGSRLGG